MLMTRAVDATSAYPLSLDKVPKKRTDGFMSGPTVSSGLRVEQSRLCVWVVIGANEYGKKRFLVIENCVRESTQSWREVLLKLKSRGMNDRSDQLDEIPILIFSSLLSTLPPT